MTNLDAPIVDVIVFVNRARITRRGSIHLGPGEHTLIIPNLPRTLDPNSIRASGKGASVRILGVDMASRYLTSTPDVDSASLQKQLDELRDQDQALVDEEAVQADQVELLKSLRENSGARFAKALATGKANIDTLKPLTQYLTDELNATHVRAHTLANQRRDLAKKIKALEVRLNQLYPSTSREWREIQVAVEASAETDLELEVLYAVSGASWEPLYDVRLVDDKVNLTYLAQVRQQSGEDWNGVQLSLSTARQATSTAIPKLSPWYVDRYVPPPPRPQATLRKTAGAAAPMMVADAAVNYAVAAAPAPPAEIEEAEVETTGSSVTYRIPRLASIPSDGSPHKTTVTTLDLESKLDYVIAPKVAQEAYLRARIKNTSVVMLLPGKAQIFHGADFVGSMQIVRVIAPAEEFEAQLGVDDRIKVERELMERTTTKVFIGNTRRVTVGYRIKLTNNLTAAAHIIVLDQLPLPRNEDIKVKLQDQQPKPSEQTDLNILKWEFDLPAGARREIPYVFTLEYPRDMSIIGFGDLELGDAQ